MSLNLNKGPGVFIDERDSFGRPISTVPASVTAFIGQTWMGPVDRPVIVTSWASFEQRFAGLHPTHMLPSTVEDYFRNGGHTAVIVRVAGDAATASAGPDPKKDEAANSSPNAPRRAKGAAKPAGAADELAPEAAPVDGKAAGALADGDFMSLLAVDTVAGPAVDSDAWLPLVAASPGAWGDFVSYSFQRVEPVPALVAAEIAAVGAEACWSAERIAAVTESLFSLSVTLRLPGRRPTVETFDYLSASADAGPLRVDRVLESRSALVRLVGQSIAKIRLPASGATGAWRLQGGRDQDGPLNAVAYLGNVRERTGLNALDDIDLINLICIPPDTRNGVGWYQTFFGGGVYDAALRYCDRRRALLLVDPPGFWATAFRQDELPAVVDAFMKKHGGDQAANAAIYFPWIRKANAANYGDIETFPACGVLAGLLARSETNEGVWKPAAGVRGSLEGVAGLEFDLSDDENGELYPAGVNCLRRFNGHGLLLWGDRAMSGADHSASPHRSLSVRRLSLAIEESLYRGTRWAVFQPNDERLWSALRTAIRAYLQHLQRQGALCEFFVKCDDETTLAEHIAAGTVNVQVGFSVVRPAEYVILNFQQRAATACPSKQA